MTKIPESLKNLILNTAIPTAIATVWAMTDHTLKNVATKTQDYALNFFQNINTTQLYQSWIVPTVKSTNTQNVKDNLPQIAFVAVMGATFTISHLIFKSIPGIRNVPSIPVVLATTLTGGLTWGMTFINNPYFNRNPEDAACFYFLGLISIYTLYAVGNTFSILLPRGFSNTMSDNSKEKLQKTTDELEKAKTEIENLKTQLNNQNTQKGTQTSLTPNIALLPCEITKSGEIIPPAYFNFSNRSQKSLQPPQSNISFQSPNHSTLYPPKSNNPSSQPTTPMKANSTPIKEGKFENTSSQ